MFRHIPIEKKNVYLKRLLMVFLYCPKHSFFKVIGESSAVVQTVKNDVFEMIRY